MNPTPVRVAVLFGFVMVNVRLVVPPSGIFDEPNAFEIVGGARTVTDALAVFPLGAFDAVTLPLTLFFTPAVVPVTSTATVHVPLAAIVPPLNVSVVSPALGVNVPQPGFALGVAATCNPDGSASVNATPVNALVVFGLVIVKVRVVTPPIGIVAAPNALLIAAPPTTVSVAVLLVAPAPLSVELIAPVVLFHTPAVIPVTVTLKLQVPAPASVPPLKLIVLGAVVVSVPPQVLNSSLARLSLPATYR